jgi:hypothetical protein
MQKGSKNKKNEGDQADSSKKESFATRKGETEKK